MLSNLWLLFTEEFVRFGSRLLSLILSPYSKESKYNSMLELFPLRVCVLNLDSILQIVLHLSLLQYPHDLWRSWTKYIIWTTVRKRTFGQVCTQRIFWSDCAYAQSDQNFRWVFCIANDATVFFFFFFFFFFCVQTTAAQVDLSLRWSDMSEGTFSHVAV